MSRVRVLAPAAVVSIFLITTPVFAQPADGVNGSAIVPSTGQGTSSLSGNRGGEGVRWRHVVNESGLFLGVAQGFRIVTQRDTRNALRGPYFRDYIDSVRGVGGWRDGDPMITNYVGHPMLGSTYMRIFTQNDPGGAPQEFGFSNKPYWTHRLKATGFSAVFSTVYELSPVGDAAIGNVGLDPSTKGAVDLVITPSVGMGWNVAEDMLDEYVVRWVEEKTGNVVINSIARTWLNPTRSVANLLRFRAPWKRDSRGNLTENRLAHRMREQQAPPERTARR